MEWIWCKHCPKYPAQSTTNMRQHLESVHGITVSKAPGSGIRTTATETVEALYTKLLLRLGDSKDDLDQEILRRTVNQQVVNQTLLDLIIVRRLPFSCVEWPEWHALVQALNPQGRVFMPTSYNTIKQRIDAWFPYAKDIVRKRLQSSQTSIHLAVDIWTSPSHNFFACYLRYLYRRARSLSKYLNCSSYSIWSQWLESIGSSSPCPRRLRNRRKYWHPYWRQFYNKRHAL